MWLYAYWKPSNNYCNYYNYCYEYDTNLQTFVFWDFVHVLHLFCTLEWLWC